MLHNQSAFRRYAWSLLGYTVFVILWGGYVRALGSGAEMGSMDFQSPMSFEHLKAAPTCLAAIIIDVSSFPVSFPYLLIHSWLSRS